MIYCTLFKSNYLDKGIVTIRSLLKNAAKAEIYVLCMDELCRQILADMGMERVHVISLDDFEDADLLAIKAQRTEAEYCWTCTAKLIKYVLEKYNKDCCTYIDADLCFYSDPQVIIEEMRSRNASVSTVEHHFPPTRSGRRLLDAEGWNCVQFNTFTNDSRGMELLNTWISQCLNECSVKSGGDQRYTNSWREYDFYKVSEQYGAGVAPWNVGRYKLQGDSPLRILDRYTKKSYPLIFYHFQRLIYFDRWHVNIEPMPYSVTMDKKLLRCLYFPYICELEKVKRELDRDFGFMPVVSNYVSDGAAPKRSLLDKLKRIASKPIGDNFDALIGKVLIKIREKETYVDVRHLTRE